MTSVSEIAAIRFGYGLRPGTAAPGGAEDLLDALRSGRDRAPRVESSAERFELLEKFLAAKGDKVRRKELNGIARQRGLEDIAARVERRAFSPCGFYERMSAFWADHFTVAARNLRRSYFVGAYEDEAIRPYVTGRFADMLKAVVRAPAMLTYLDQVGSIGPNSNIGKKSGRGLNENLAREILELHTLGVGAGYTQGDVREFAELLTGFGARRRSMRFRFKSNWAEPGTETVLGREYGGDPPRAEHVDALLEDLARHPATARHLARKLAVHFVSDEPDPDLIAHIAAAWNKSDGDLLAVTAAMLDHPAAWQNPGSKVKRPVELVASTLRAVGDVPILPKDPIKRGRQMLRAMQSMGQVLFKPPAPDGWPETAGDWITPQGLAGRLQFASAVGRRLARSAGLDPRVFAERTLGGALGDTTRFVVGAAPDRWEGFALLLASPEFNRR